MRTRRPSHVRADGTVAMVDVGAKPVSERSAQARAVVRMGDEAEAALRNATLRKGDAFTVAQLAGMLGAKHTATLIPLAHPIELSHIDVSLAWAGAGRLQIDAVVKSSGRTGVEMEAMTAAAIAALALYDMLKSVEKGVVIESIGLIEKRGGKSGAWRAADRAP